MRTYFCLQWKNDLEADHDAYYLLQCDTVITTCVVLTDRWVPGLHFSIVVTCYTMIRTVPVRNCLPFTMTVPVRYRDAGKFPFNSAGDLLTDVIRLRRTCGDTDKPTCLLLWPPCLYAWPATPTILINACWRLYWRRYTGIGCCRK